MYEIRAAWRQCDPHWAVPAAGMRLTHARCVPQSGAASAATAAQYTGAAVMLIMLARKDLLLPKDMLQPPPLQQWVDTLRPGIPFAFCIAAVVTALLTATNLATGAPTSRQTCIQHAHFPHHKPAAALPQHLPLLLTLTLVFTLSAHSRVSLHMTLLQLWARSRWQRTPL